MSDRERCKDCVYCKMIRPHTSGFYCSHPVPYWALPSVMVNPDMLTTCPTFTPIKNEQNNTN